MAHFHGTGSLSPRFIYLLLPLRPASRPGAVRCARRHGVMHAARPFRQPAASADLAQRRSLYRILEGDGETYPKGSPGEGCRTPELRLPAGSWAQAERGRTRTAAAVSRAATR